MSLKRVPTGTGGFLLNILPTLVIIIIIIIIIIIVIIISSNNNDNNTYIAPISILLFSSALEIKKYLKKIPRLH